MFTLFFSCWNVSVDVLLSPGLVQRKSRCSQGWTKLCPLASALVPGFVALWSEDKLLSTFTLEAEIFFEASVGPLWCACARRWTGNAGRVQGAEPGAPRPAGLARCLSPAARGCASLCRLPRPLPAS